MHRVLTGLATLFLVGSWTWGSSLAAMPPKNPSHHSDRSIPRGTIPVKIYRGFLVVAEGQFGGTASRKSGIMDNELEILNLSIIHS